MSNNKRILVPMYLDALVQAATDPYSWWQDMSLQFKSVTKSRYTDSLGLGQYLEPQLNNFSDHIHAPGIHLHWTLPEIFRHSKQTEADTKTNFNMAPNRWLVVRICEGNSIPTKAWIVESDYDNTTPDQYNLIVEQVANGQSMGQHVAGNTDQLYVSLKQVGRWLEIDGWEESNQPMFLTLMSPGNPDFAASYMHCKGVFGFHDSEVSDLKAPAELSYMVYGWLSDASKNPFSGIDLNSFKKTLSSIKWKIDGIDTRDLQDADIPGDIMCHSIIYSVMWPGSQKSVHSKVPSISGINVGVGNSVTEALSTLLVPNNSTAAAQLGAAYQYKMLRDYGVMKNASATERTILSLVKKPVHAKSFISVRAGTFWVAEPKKKNMPDTGQAGQYPLFTNSAPDPLRALNTAQRNYDAAKNALVTIQADYYANLYKSQYTQTAAVDLPDSYSAQQLTDTINSLKSSVQNQIAQVNDFEAALANCKTILTCDPAMKDYDLKETHEPPFFEPSEPAIAIAGLFSPGQTANEKYTSKDTIVCRWPGKVADSISVQCGGTGPANTYTVKGCDIPSKIGSDTQAIIETIRNKKNVPPEALLLLYEALLTNPGMTGFIAAAAYAISKVGANSGLQQMISDRSNPGMYSNKDSPSLTSDDLPAAFSVNKWQQPWTPLYMQWTVQWKSSYSDLSAIQDTHDPFTGTWARNIDNTDYALSANATLQTSPVTYSGLSLLSMDWATKISGINAKLKPYTTGSEDFFENGTPMVQVISGFNNQLITRYHGIQFPILAEEEALPWLVVDQDSHQLIDSQYLWRPAPDGNSAVSDPYPFFPLRAGMFCIQSLRVIDSFGQVVRIIEVPDTAINSLKNSDVRYSAGLQPTSVPPDGYFVLPPRLAQSARLRFDWISAEDGTCITDGDPESSPVCGWLLHNRLDGSISVFSRAGEEIAEILHVGDETKLEGNQTEVVSPFREKKIIYFENKTLETVVNFIATGGNFKDMLDSIQSVNDTAQMKSSRQLLTMALPIGYPIAVVKASCLLELKEQQPARNYSWPSNLPDPNFAGIQYPVAIGDSNNVFDGVVGYFIDGNYYRPSGSTPANCSETQSGCDGFRLTLGTPVKLTLLIDPRMAVHVSTGILPDLSIQLPDNVIVQPLQSINLRFFAAPVITPASSYKVPLLKSKNTSPTVTGVAGQQGAPAGDATPPNTTGWEFITMDENKNPISNTPDLTKQDVLKFEPLHAIDGWLRLNKKDS